MTRLLVTGADGFVGSHVVEQARGRGWDVAGFDLYDEFPAEPVDVVISLAATADPQAAIRNGHLAYLNGVRVMLETLDYAAAVGARVLHVSTNEVYGRLGRDYYSDVGGDLPVFDPRSPYAGAKACQEIVCRAQSDVPVTIVVTQSLFGERQQRNKLVPSAVRSLLAGTPVALQGGGDRWAERPFLYVGDLARVLLDEAASQPSWPYRSSPFRDRIHIGATRRLSVARVVAALAEGLGVEVKVKQVPAGDRAGHELEIPVIGWEWDGEPTPALNVLPGLARWYRDHPEWL